MPANMMEMKCYVYHVMSCHVKLGMHMMIDMYMMHIWNMSWMKREKEMMLMLCYEWKSWGLHSCMYVMCIGMLLHYVMLVQTLTFNIYGHDIMHAFLFLWCPVILTCCAHHVRSTGYYTSPPGGSTCTYVGRVCWSTTHQTLPETEKSLRSYYGFKE